MPYVNFFCKANKQKVSVQLLQQVHKKFYYNKTGKFNNSNSLTAMGLLLNQVAMLMEFLFGNTFEQYCDGKFFRYATFVNDF